MFNTGEALPWLLFFAACTWSAVWQHRYLRVQQRFADLSDHLIRVIYGRLDPEVLKVLNGPNEKEPEAGEKGCEGSGGPSDTG